MIHNFDAFLEELIFLSYKVLNKRTLAKSFQNELFTNLFQGLPCTTNQFDSFEVFKKVFFD